MSVKTLEQYLQEFSETAEDWFAGATFLKDNYDFFHQFFKKEDLEVATWEVFQGMRPHIHSFTEMAIAGTKALGKQNHEIEYYRRSFIMLRHGEEPLAERIDKFFSHKDFGVRQFGRGAVSEIAANLFPAECIMYNERDRKAAEFLRLAPKLAKGTTFGNELLQFCAAMEPVREAYLSIVEERTELPLNLEIDQFFSWLYEKHITNGVKPPGSTNYWLVQANPKIWNLEDNLTRWKIGEVEDWTLSRYRNRVTPGDRVAIWQAGPKSGLYALGTINAKPHKRDNGELAIDIRLDKKLGAYVPRDVVRNTPGLEALQVVRSPQGTNFTVTPEEWTHIEELANGAGNGNCSGYVEPGFAAIGKLVAKAGLKIDKQTLRRYHLSLKTRKFVILSGVSGTGKTWLGEEYAKAAGAKLELVPVAPDWTSNEDLLGYYNPLDGTYHDTPFSRLLRRADECWKEALEKGVEPTPYHLLLDEMNLARVEYYFARFLSVMELRQRHGSASIDLGPGDTVTLPPNLYFIGTVNIDETTHGFADKVFDRAQIIELHVSTSTMKAHVAGKPYSKALLEVFEIVQSAAPFGFRVADEIATYVEQAGAMGISWATALDEQLLQKVLPKLSGASLAVGEALAKLVDFSTTDYPLTAEKAKRMKEGHDSHGFATYF